MKYLAQKEVSASQVSLEILNNEGRGLILDGPQEKLRKSLEKLKVNGLNRYELPLTHHLGRKLYFSLEKMSYIHGLDKDDLKSLDQDDLTTLIHNVFNRVKLRAKIQMFVFAMIPIVGWGALASGLDKEDWDGPAMISFWRSYRGLLKLGDNAVKIATESMKNGRYDKFPLDVR